MSKISCMKNSVFVVSFFFFFLPDVKVIFAQVNTNNHYVSGYYKSNGTYVSGHHRTNPNQTNRDNYTTKPNINPYTGKKGYIKPDNYSNNVGADELEQMINARYQSIEHKSFLKKLSNKSECCKNAHGNWDDVQLCCPDFNNTLEEIGEVIFRQTLAEMKGPEVMMHNNDYNIQTNNLDYPTYSYNKLEQYPNYSVDNYSSYNSFTSNHFSKAINYHNKYSYDKRKSIEIYLSKLGFFNENPDGYFNDNTILSIRLFQENEKLVVDGRVGEKTLEKLKYRFMKMY